jgi:hypothetical protein
MTITEKCLSTTQIACKFYLTASKDNTADSRATYYAYHLGQEVQRHHQRCLAWQDGTPRAVPFAAERDGLRSVQDDTNP